MNNDLKLKNYFGEDSFNRILEVMNILGLSLSEDYEIKYDVFGDNEEWAALKSNIDSGLDLYIVLQEISKPNEKEFITPFENPYYAHIFKNKIQLVKNSDGKIIIWEKDNNKETLRIAKDRNSILETSFETLSESFYTSTLQINKDYKRKKFTTTGKKVNPYDEVNYPISDYYNVVSNYINSNEFNQKFSESEIDKKLILDFIDTPIKNVLDDLLNNDQSQRIDYLLKKYKNEYYKALRQAKRNCEREKRSAEERYKYEVESSTYSYQLRLKELKDEYKKY